MQARNWSEQSHFSGKDYDEGVERKIMVQPVYALIGTVGVEFTGCNAGWVSYDITSVDRQGRIPIQRITLDNVPLCQALDDPEPVVQE